MKAVTKTYTRNGSFVEDSTILELGKSVAASTREPQIISLSVSHVSVISNISLEVISSQNADLGTGFLQYYTCRDILEDFSNITKKTWSKNDPIFVRNATDTSSEYIYIWINPQKINITGDGFVRFKWKFDYIEGSSSSSSSSSCQLGRYYNIWPYEDARLLVSPCEIKYFQINIDPEEYVTIYLNGDPIVMENDGGMLVVNGIIILDSEYQSVVNIGENQYSVYLIDTDPFFVRLYKISDCTINDHLLLSDNGDLLLIDDFRLRLLGDDPIPGDVLLLTNDEELYLVDGFKFLLIGRGTDYSSSSSSAAENLDAYAVYTIVNGSYDRSNTFIVPRCWFNAPNSPHNWTFVEGWQWDDNYEYAIYTYDTGQQCLGSSDCSNVVYTFDWDSIPEPPDATIWPPPTE